MAESSTTAVCDACPRHCRLAPGALGACRARRNSNGVVICENYGRATSLALDPVEKKPLANFMPGRLVLSVGSYGCNLSCPFCQNHAIAQVDANEVPWREIAPEELVHLAERLRAEDRRVAGIAYTYNEPLAGWEYVRDCAELARRHRLVNVLVSNGCASPQVINTVAPLIDAVNIDLKGFSPAAYRRLGGAPSSFEAVLQSIEAFAALPACDLEVTTLVVPVLNDADAEVEAMASWLAALDGGHGKETITYHLTRFFGRWKMADAAPTPVATLHRLAGVARRHLDRVRLGNC